MNFITDYLTAVEKVVGLPCKVEVHRGTSYDHQKWVELTMGNVREYEYAQLIAEQYRVSVRDITPNKENGYWDGYVCRWSLQYLPGCCGVCISFHAAVGIKYQNKGLGKLSRAFREKIATQQGFTTLLSTSTTGNLKHTSVLKSSKDSMPIYTFSNRRTNNEVMITVCDLSERQTTSIPVKRPDFWDKKSAPVMPGSAAA